MRDFEQCLKDEYNKGYADAKAKYEPKWIRVEDGLPEHNTSVLIAVPNFKISISALWDEKYQRFYLSNSAFEKDDVIAWMSIPKYKGGD